ncbi:MAG: Histone deacetylase domain protein [Deltaproteobacteria bacterium ADurb.Bin510]|nr:MAG: Histone deacetylase domain protein [Deltaproteobacteria bacterium ADurb.Bin510]
MTMSELIRPVLDEFAPDLVINSAGQDNHYSDPITNMAFTAGGYARLTELLRPDICVLEGGYSIEQALPYINTGIILALAGVDYSYLREPDLNRERIKDKPQNLDYTKQLCRQQLKRWRERPGRPAEVKLVSRQRSIYYDTDSISEIQQETLRLCPRCAGALRIDTSATTGRHVLCIHVPRAACRECRAQAESWFVEGQAGYATVYLQDLERDEYRVAGR